MTRRKSDLVTLESLSPNCARPRTSPVSRLSPHCVAGKFKDAKSILGLQSFKTYNQVTGASCTYAIGSDGSMGLGVSETDRPWTTSSRTNDDRAITFEISNSTLGPDWKMTDEAINSWINLAEDICRFYGYKKVNYRDKPDSVPVGNVSRVEAWIATWAKPDEMIITLHRWYKPKACPGAYFVRQLPWIVSELNKRLSGGIPSEFVGEGVAATPVEPDTSSFAPYQVKSNTVSLNIRSGPGTNFPVSGSIFNNVGVYTIVEEVKGPGASKWGKLKSGAGWIALDYTKRL